RWTAGLPRDGKLVAGPDPAAYLAFADALDQAYATRLATMGDSGPAPSCTTHLSVVDRHGNMAALTQTLLARFGSKVPLPETGILMNNGIMWFDPRPGRPNSLAPAKRPLCNMCPVILARDGQPWLAAGGSGGRRILAAVTQLLNFVVDFGFDAAAAAHHPRVDVSGTSTISADPRLAPEALPALRQAGHPARGGHVP